MTKIVITHRGIALPVLGYVPVHTIRKPLKWVGFGQEIEGVQVQVIEQMLRIRWGDNHGRVIPQGIQKRTRYFIAGVRKPEKHQGTIVWLYAGKHVLRKRPGLTKLEPAGALEVVGKLASTRPWVIQGEVGSQWINWLENSRPCPSIDFYFAILICGDGI